MNEQKVLEIGLVMPIAGIEDCTPAHWLDVQAILKDAVTKLPGFDDVRVQLVSDGNSIGLIHKRIVQGLYNSHVVICDVSCKNPNVMFELGMRLAFDKPTVIVKDNQTSYTFDTSGIEHLEYPRDLRFQKIVEFKEILASKVLATYEDSIKDQNYSPFLKSFGSFKVATLEQTEVSIDRMVLESMLDVQTQISELKNSLGIEKRKIAFDNYPIPLDEATIMLSLQSELSRICVERGIVHTNLINQMSYDEITSLLLNSKNKHIVKAIKDNQKKYQFYLYLAMESFETLFRVEK